MKMLHHKVNIVPVIAKADMLTKKEIARLKKRVQDYYKFNLCKLSVTINFFILIGYGRN